MLVDVLRAIHQGLPSTLSIFEILSHFTPLNDEVNLGYSSLVVDHMLPPPSLSSDGAFLTLVVIIGSIHSLYTTFYPLQHSLISATSSTVFFNPYLPFSTLDQNRETGERLQKALELWREQYFLPCQKADVALFHFGRMYSVLPSLMTLPVLAQYPPRRIRNDAMLAKYSKSIASELQDSPEASKYAWAVLESIDKTATVTPMWYPIVVFYAGLVVWQAIKIKIKVESGGYSSLRVLALFKNELEHMNWPCCGVMAKTLDGLIL